MSIEVIKAGALSTIQDAGRYGFQKLGVPVCGPMDVNAHRLANILAGNSESLGALEITLMGPVLRFTQSACIAIAGADLGAVLDGEALAVNRPHIIRAGQTLGFSGARSGIRAYLAVHGGFKVRPVLNSQSTYLKGRFGGHQGGPLKAGDRLELNTSVADDALVLEKCEQALWETRIYLPASSGSIRRPVLRIVKGPHWPLFTADSISDLLTRSFKISPQSDRMGYRLNGPRLEVTAPQQILSEVTAFGAIQVPHGGDPIVLMADRQTMGGYPKIAYIASVDLPSLAQSRPGESVSFRLIALDEAQALDLKREQAFTQLKESLAHIKLILEQDSP